MNHENSIGKGVCKVEFVVRVDRGKRNQSKDGLKIEIYTDVLTDFDALYDDERT